MASPHPGPVPGHTVVGARGQLERLAAQEFHLLLLEGGTPGLSYALDKAETRVGKAPENDIHLDHPTVSRSHLVILRQGDRFLVHDLNSTNGTFVDGAQVKEAYLRPGAILEVGDVQLRFQPKVAPVEIAPLVDSRLGELWGKSVPMRKIFALLSKISITDSTLLLVGETGTGKGAAAKTIHSLSKRSAGPFVVFDCAAVSDSLIESELFGHEKGAFTGAISQRIGCLERANGGTLFLDEVDDLSLDLQPKLLRAIEDREVRRLGASGTIGFDARIIAASKKDLWAETQGGRFREDLYFRMSVFTVFLPPVRDRKEDIPLLVDSFGTDDFWGNLPQDVREQFLAHSWPGNVRELRNAIERARQMAQIPELSSQTLLREFTAAPEARSAPLASADSLPVEYALPFKDCKDKLVRSFEREYLSRLLAQCKGNIARCAREAQLDRKYLYSLLHKYGFAPGEAE